MRFHLLTAACLLGASPVLAQTDAPPIRPGQVEWLEPTRAEVHPQTDAEKNAGQERGRALPTPELLQPSLDPALPPYIPTKGLAIRRAFTAGSSDVLPGLVAAWITAFQRYQPGFQMTIAKPYAGSLGALELIKGNLDLVFVSRELKPTDIAGFRDRFGYPPFSVPVSGGTWRHFGFLDALAVMVNPANPVRSLSFRQLDAAFSSTRARGGAAVKTWGDLGVTGPQASHPVHLYGIKPWNGFEEFFRQRVLSTPGHRGEWASGIAYDETFFNLARRVAADPDALGYTGLSAVDSEVKVVPLSVDGGAPLSPSYENVAAATYPLSRVTYLNTNARDAAALDPALREFIRFVLSREGQEVVRAQGVYLPLRAGQAAASRAYAGAEAALALALLLATGAGGAEPPRCVAVVGYNDMDRMIAAAAARVRARHPDYCYALDLKSTRSGPPALIAGRADLAPMGAAMTPADLAAYRARWGTEPIVVRIAHDSLAPAALSSPIGALVAAANPLTAISMAALRRAFTQAPAPTWGDLGGRGDWADRPVHLHALAPDTAIGAYLLAGPLAAPGFAPAVETARQSRDVGAAIAADPLALGLANLNRAGEGTRALPLVTDRGATVRPDAATIAAGRWPMDRHLLIYIRRQADGRIAPAARALVAFLLSREGQAIVAAPPRRYLPLNTRERAIEREKLSGLGV